MSLLGTGKLKKLVTGPHKLKARVEDKVHHHHEDSTRERPNATPPRRKGLWKNHVTRAFNEIKSVDIPNIVSGLPSDQSSPKTKKPDSGYLEQPVIKTGMLQKRSRIRGKLSKSHAFWAVLRMDEISFFHSAGVRSLILCFFLNVFLIYVGKETCWKHLHKAYIEIGL